MFYKPTYCCHCGEKIERTEWLPWTSGRFCEVCDQEFKFQERLPLFFMLIFTIFGLIGIGGYLKSGEKASPVALKQNKFAVSDIAGKKEFNENAPQISNSQVVQKIEPGSESNISVNANKNVAEKRKTGLVTAEAERVYLCGAATKKGTPCSRKVKGGGRCWQHKGQEALLPEEKLLITQ